MLNQTSLTDYIISNATTIKNHQIINSSNNIPQQSPIKSYTNQMQSNIQNFETKKLKDISSANKGKSNLENQLVNSNQVSIKKRFEEIKKKYERKDRTESLSFGIQDKLKQVTQNQINISMNKGNQLKSNISSYQKQIFTRPDKLNEINKERSFYKLKQEKQENSIIKQKKNNVSQNNNFVTFNQRYSLDYTKLNKQISTKYIPSNGNITFHKNQQIDKIILQKKPIQESLRLEQERIESIDKINQKIQKIMKCINQTEKYAQDKSHLKKLLPYNNSSIHNPRRSFQKSDFYEKDKFRNKDNYQQKYQLFMDPAPQKQKAFDNKNSIQKLQKKKVEINNNRSTSLLPRSTTTKLDGNQCKLSNGKDLDDQIKKIHEKIKRSEEQKKKLNIKFEGFKDYPNKSKNELNSKNQSIQLNNCEKIRNDESVKKQIKLVQNIQKPKVNQLKFNFNEQYFNKFKNQTKSSQIITEKDLKCVQKSRLTENLKQQVILDEKLRDAKLIFSANQINQKWNKLLTQLNKNNIKLSETQTKQQFQITLQQHDPFFSVRHNTLEQSIQSLALKYKQAKEHYMNNIKHQFNRQILVKQQFKEQSLDLQKKGYLTIEDFVRYLNFQTGTFYRNRDLVLLFKRFTKDTQITYEQLLKILSQ